MKKNEIKKIRKNIKRTDLESSSSKSRWQGARKTAKKYLRHWAKSAHPQSMTGLVLPPTVLLEEQISKTLDSAH